MKELEHLGCVREISRSVVSRHGVLKITIGEIGQKEVQYLAFSSFILDHRGVYDLNDVRMTKPTIRFGLPHGFAHSFMTRRDEYLFQGVKSIGRGVPDEVDERESAFTQKLLDLVSSPVDLQRLLSAERMLASKTLKNEAYVWQMH